jgi:predicted nuclease of restriction endonuclease-like (RecB) superfamily
MNKPTTANSVFSEVLEQIQQTRQKIFSQANAGLIDLYWQIGKTISHKVQSAAWGKGVVSELARYIAENAPEMKGFSDKNLWRMKQFYETYQADEKLATLWRELPWTHNTIIFSRCKSPEEREYYLRLTIADKLNKRELECQIDSAYFQRSLMATKLSPLVRELHPSISQVFKFLPKPIAAIKLNVSLKNPVGWISAAHPPCWPSRWMRYAYPPYGAKLHEWLAQELECAK